MSTAIADKDINNLVFALSQAPIKRGDIFNADLGLTCGSMQSGERPFLILSNNLGNRHSTLIWGVPLTTSKTKSKLPTHVYLDAYETGLKYDSIAMLEQPRTLHKWFLFDKITTLTNEQMKDINKALMISAGMV